MNHALAATRARGHGAVICLATRLTMPLRLLGAQANELSLPGPFERDRLLALELRDCALTTLGP